ncbi:MAG TPA: hydrogenase maturation protease [Anaerolineae bacterium]|nr:hydrogenase maturation protease [Anaerolineae bacterium]
MATKRTLVLGLGNPILCDDGIGVRVAWAVAEQLDNPNVTVAEASVGGLRLLELLIGYDRAILVDAIQTENGCPGEIYHLTPADLEQSGPSLHISSTHDVDFLTALRVGREMGWSIPEEIIIYAVEAVRVQDFGEEMTPAVAAALPVVTEAILREVG